MTEVKAIVVSDSCSHCDEVKDYLKGKGLTKKVKLIQYETPEGRKFCTKHKIRAVPECVVITDEKGKKVRVCTPKEFKKLLLDGC